MGTNQSTPGDQNRENRKRLRAIDLDNVDRFSGSEGELSNIAPTPEHSVIWKQPRPRRIDTLT